MLNKNPARSYNPRDLDKLDYRNLFTSNLNSDKTGISIRIARLPGK